MVTIVLLSCHRRLAFGLHEHTHTLSLIFSPHYGLLMVCFRRTRGNFFVKPCFRSVPWPLWACTRVCVCVCKGVCAKGNSSFHVCRAVRFGRSSVGIWFFLLEAKRILVPITANPPNTLDALGVAEEFGGVCVCVSILVVEADTAFPVVRSEITTKEKGHSYAENSPSITRSEG